jgi:hypothetical protein
MKVRRRPPRLRWPSSRSSSSRRRRFPVQDRPENVVIAVEEEPTDEDYDLTDTFIIISSALVQTECGFDLPGLPPETLLPRILRRTRNNPKRSRDWDTVVHELGHYFGLHEDESF